MVVRIAVTVSDSKTAALCEGRGFLEGTGSNIWRSLQDSGSVSEVLGSMKNQDQMVWEEGWWTYQLKNFHVPEGPAERKFMDAVSRVLWWDRKGCRCCGVAKTKRSWFRPVNTVTESSILQYHNTTDLLYHSGSSCWKAAGLCGRSARNIRGDHNFILGTHHFHIQVLCGYGDAASCYDLSTDHTEQWFGTKDNHRLHWVPVNSSRNSVDDIQLCCWRCSAFNWMDWLVMKTTGGSLCSFRHGMKSSESTTRAQ